MAYDKEKILKTAKAAIKKYKLIFIEEIVHYLPCTKSTFYEFFPAESDESDAIKELLEKNKVDLKVSLRSKWYKSENATLQMGLMRLIATPEEHQKLNQTYIDHTNKGSKFNDGKIIIAGQKFAGQNIKQEPNESAD